VKPPSPDDSAKDHTPKTVAVILAAGLGTRMKSRTPKVLHPLCGRPMLAYVIDAAREATGRRPIVVYSPASAAVQTVFEGAADFALQDEPRGTGDALRVALPSVPEDVAEILVLSGDVPQVDVELLRDLQGQRQFEGSPMALVAVQTLEPGGLGRLVRAEDGSIERIVEVKDANPQELEIDEINAGLYAFDTAWVRRRIGDLRASATTGEIYLTHLVELARADGTPPASLSVEDDGRLLGINDRFELAEAERDMRTEINARHMWAGVSMRDPATTYIDATVELAPDVTLESNVILRGRTKVGEGTFIGAGSQIVDSVIGANCRVVASVIESSEVEDQVEIGPSSHLRAGSHIGHGSEIGNFAEIKNSRLGARVRQHHMSYMGDADVGARTNIGAGTITANYDGTQKHRTTIGEDVFLGVDTMLRAPVALGDGAKTGAGAVVTRDVPPGKLAVGVPARIREPRGAPRASEAPRPPEAKAELGSEPATDGQNPASRTSGPR
jgi:bifunctional UDP-N-acetylglucosamine pyrophosphorylase/glucosamine-1-phosphate N-acetyltransferase